MAAVASAEKEEPPPRGAVKSTERRLEECMQIRAQLQRVGAYVEDANRKAIADAMNAYVTRGEPASISVRLGRGPGAAVATLSLRPRKQSGVTMSMPP